MRAMEGRRVALQAGERNAVAQPDLREHNLTVVMLQLSESGAASRTELAAATHLTKTTVGHIVDDLLGRGLVIELGTVEPSGRGRPATQLAIDPSAVAAIGLELNVLHAAVRVTDLAGDIVFESRLALPTRGDPATVVRSLEPMLIEAFDAADRQCRTIAGLVVAVPGFMASTGRVLDAPTLGWTDVELLPLVEAVLPRGVDVRFDSVSSLASIAEERLLRTRAPHSMLHIEFGAVVGSALVVNGFGQRGASRALGALGHVSLDPAGPTCRCGRRGCIEALVGMEALGSLCLPLAPSDVLADPDRLVGEIVALASADSAAVMSGLNEMSQRLAQVVAMMVNILDPEVVILGGYVPPLAPWLLDNLRQGVLTLVPAAKSMKFELEVSPLGAGGALSGATMMTRDRVLSRPSHFPGR